MKNLATLLLLVFAGCSTSEPEYFPDGTISSEWYSEKLYALYQTPLHPRAADPENRIYRFTWLRTFHNPICVRLTILGNGTGEIETSRTNGAGGYDPGTLSYRATTRVPRADVDTFLTKVDEAKFWDTPTDPRKKVVMPDGSVLMQFGADGAQWILEAVDNGKYHVVDYWSPKPGKYRDALEFLLEISGVEYGPVY